MTRLRLWAVLFLSALGAACGSKTTTVLPAVADVVVSPATTQVEIGVSVQLTGEARSTSGDEIPGQIFTWTSLAPAVATVDADGYVTGVSAGSADIRAEVSGVSGTATVTVIANPCDSGRTDVIIAPGDFAAFDSDECLLLPAGSAGDLYRVAVARPTLIEDTLDVSTVTLSMDPVLTTAPPRVPDGPSPAGVRAPAYTGPRIDAGGVLAHLELQARTRAFHVALRQRERELAFGPDALLPSRPAAAPPLRADPPANTMLYLDISCSAGSREPAVLIDFDENLAIYQDSVSHATAPLTTTATDLMQSYYASYVRDMVRDYWGAMPDVDGNDGRLIVVTTSSLDEGAAAAVFSGDLVSTASCPTSNQAEVMYFQLDVLADLEASSPDYFGLGVLAHEAKHVTSLYNGIQRGLPSGPDFHEIWIEEGTAEVSQVMSSRIAWAATGGPALGDRITANDIVNGAVGNSPTAEMTGLTDALAGMALTLTGQPNSLTVDPVGASQNHSFYGSSWHWHRFLGDAYGNAATALADTAFFRMLHDPDAAQSGIAREQVLTGKTFVELFDELLVAMSYNGTGFTPAEPITTWSFPSAAEVFVSPVVNPPGRYPWPVTTTSTLGDTVSYVPYGQRTFTGVMGPSGIRFHDFESNGVGAGVQIYVTGAYVSSGSGPVPGRIVVTRLD